MEVEESSFIIHVNKFNMTVPTNERQKVCEAEQPQHHMTIEKYEMN